MAGPIVDDVFCFCLFEKCDALSKRCVRSTLVVLARPRVCLILKDNKLSALPSGVWAALKGIRTLDLSGNALTWANARFCTKNMISEGTSWASLSYLVARTS